MIKYLFYYIVCAECGVFSIFSRESNTHASKMSCIVVMQEQSFRQIAQKGSVIVTLVDV